MQYSRALMRRPFVWASFVFAVAVLVGLVLFVAALAVVITRREADALGLRRPVSA
jgi:hypothetical protein